MTRREGVAIALCYSGIGLAFVHDLNVADARSVWIGGGLVFASSVSYALYLSGSTPMIVVLIDRISTWLTAALAASA